VKSEEYPGIKYEGHGKSRNFVVQCHVVGEQLIVVVTAVGIVTRLEHFCVHLRHFFVLHERWGE
jgi:hypothetical protein